MTTTVKENKRGKELDAMDDTEFVSLWDKYRHFTPNELNAAEPFYVVVAMKKLKALVKAKQNA